MNEKYEQEKLNQHMSEADDIQRMMEEKISQKGKRRKNSYYGDYDQEWVNENQEKKEEEFDEYDGGCFDFDPLEDMYNDYY